MSALSPQGLDLVLVPCSLLLMFSYNLYFLYRYLRCPSTTVMGVECDDKRAWVDGMLQMKLVDRSVGSGVISSNLSAATFFSSVCLTLCSLLAAWIASSNPSIFAAVLIYGDTKPSTMAIKHLCLFVSFLMAFSCFLQSTRHYVHACYLISTPEGFVDSEDVKVVVIRGDEFWSLGNRALYFALALLMWYFGPVLMLLSSVLLVVIQYHHDVRSIPLKRKLRPRPLDAFASKVGI
ncbi:hypothetical protein MLD38_037056 [Melastoma candidum]|uniref:Uncharacterized protein n=1 Tax=Melastoma candidum TaxID=119954 RepID=A0ACB9LLN1_9MYRT|nr:hypothetical protein MLD38_037056 [Melastoma candidum]